MIHPTRFHPPRPWRRSALLVLLLAVLAPASGPGHTAGADDAPPEAARDAAAAAALLARGEHAAAAEAYQRLLDEALARGTGPGTVDEAALAPLRRGLARALLALDRAYDALPVLERLAHAGDPDDRLLHAEALVAHARAAIEAGARSSAQVVPYLDDALRTLGPLADSAPHAAAAGALAGEALRLRGDLAGAVRVWQRVPRAEPPGPRDLWLLERLARALYDLGRPAEAAPLYREAGNARGAAAALTAARDAEGAVEAYAALLAARPDDGAVLEEAAAAAQFLGGEALPRLRARLDAAEPGPGAVRAWQTARARLAEALGDTAGAAGLLREALAGSTGPERTALRLRLVRVLLGARTDAGGARDEAVSLVVAAVGDDPGSAPALETAMALAQRELSEAWSSWPDERPLERSLALQQALLRATPDDPVAWANLGNTLRVAGRSAAALEAFARALALAPGDAALENDLGLALAAAGRHAEAGAAFERALAADPAFLSARQNLARRAWRAGDDATAQEHLARAAQAARRSGAPWMLYRVLADRAWRTQQRPDRR